MKRYIKKYKTEREVFYEIPINSHRNAKNNPYAQFKFEIDREIIESSPVVAEPLHLLECAPVSDGAASAVITPERGDVDILSCELSAGGYTIMCNEVEIPSTKKASHRAFEKSGLKREDVDLVEVHDAFSIIGAIALEDMGFIKKGEFGKFVEKNSLGKEGELPTNMSGGLKAGGHPVGATGIYQTVFATKMMRGDIDIGIDRDICLLHNIGGVGVASAVTLLGV